MMERWFIHGKFATHLSRGDVLSKASGVDRNGYIIEIPREI